MNNKRVFGQYYTTHNPFDHILFKEWVELFISDINTVIEPFAGSNNIPYLLQSIGYNFTWKCYDIEPGTSVVNELNIEKRDTINNLEIIFGSFNNTSLEYNRFISRKQEEKAMKNQKKSNKI